MEFVTKYESSVIRFDVSNYSAIRRLVWEQTVWRNIVKKYNPDVLFSSANFGLFNCPVKQILLLREGGLFDPFYLANMSATLGVINGFGRSIRRKLMLFSAMSADYIMTPTRVMRELVILWNPVISDKIEVNAYGTINNSFKPSKDKRIWRADGMCRLLYVSVYYPHKVPYTTCLAVDNLNNSGLMSHATITMSLAELENMSGSGLDKEIVSEASERNIVDLGNYEYGDLPELYQAHDVFIFPSVSETFGHPMAEAMSSGIPVVAADTAVNREICGDAALYFKPFSISEMADCVRQLDQDQRLRESLIKIGLMRANKLFNWEDHVNRLSNMIQKLS